MRILATFLLMINISGLAFCAQEKLKELQNQLNASLQKIPHIDDIDSDEYKGELAESNWVVPGRFMMGAYPAHEDDKIHQENLQTLLDEGFRTFVCLMDEYEHFDPDIEQKSNEGQKSRRPYVFDMKKILEKMNSNTRPVLLHLKIRDGKVAPDNHMQNLAMEICMRLYQGEKIYLHCWGGHGRAGTIVAIVLGMLYGFDADKALEFTQKMHDTREDTADALSPQTKEQRDQVKRVLKKIGGIKCPDILKYAKFNRLRPSFRIYPEPQPWIGID